MPFGPPRRPRQPDSFRPARNSTGGGSSGSSGRPHSSGGRPAAGGSRRPAGGSPHRGHSRPPHSPQAPEPKSIPRKSGPITLPEAFRTLGVAPKILQGLAEEGYEHPTPIQLQAIPPALEGRDLLACAQTGTGKTAAFVIPLLQRLAASSSQAKIRALVLTPTRELASQIAERAAAYGRHLGMKQTVIFGGVGQGRQETALRGRLDLCIATPGRLIDLMQQRFVHLEGCEVFVLDEADRMLDMGFLPDVRRIVATLPAVRQTLLFSATMPPDIARLANTVLRDAVRINVAPTVTTAAKIEQVLFHVPRGGKTELLEGMLKTPEMRRAIVFTRTKRGADKLHAQLERSGFGAAVIHGNKSQGARERALEAFRVGRTKVLIATDIAARGIDVDGISHVVNYDLPDVAEGYVHRIGRTGRAGNSGIAVTFCDPEERALLIDVERFIKKPIPLAPGQIAPTGPVPPPPGRKSKGGGGHGAGRKSGGGSARGGYFAPGGRRSSGSRRPTR